VLKVESDEIVGAVRKKGIPVEYVLFDDEGHGFVKKENEIKGYTRVLEFLDRYLKEETRAPGPRRSSRDPVRQIKRLLLQDARSQMAQNCVLQSRVCRTYQRHEIDIPLRSPARPS
jgi:hypothetical protein